LGLSGSSKRCRLASNHLTSLNLASTNLKGFSGLSMFRSSFSHSPNNQAGFRGSRIPFLCLMNGFHIEYALPLMYLNVYASGQPKCTSTGLMLFAGHDCHNRRIARATVKYRVTILIGTSHVRAGPNSCWRKRRAVDFAYEAIRRFRFCIWRHHAVFGSLSPVPGDNHSSKYGQGWQMGDCGHTIGSGKFGEKSERNILRPLHAAPL
jgi:hypothetical protein